MISSTRLNLSLIHIQMCIRDRYNVILGKDKKTLKSSTPSPTTCHNAFAKLGLMQQSISVQIIERRGEYFNTFMRANQLNNLLRVNDFKHTVKHLKRCVKLSTLLLLETLKWMKVILNISLSINIKFCFRYILYVTKVDRNTEIY